MLMPSSERIVLASFRKSGISLSISIKSFDNGHVTSSSGLKSVAGSWTLQRCKHVRSFMSFLSLFHNRFVREPPWVESPIIAWPMPERCCLTWCHRPDLGLASIIVALQPSRLSSLFSFVANFGKVQLDMILTSVIELSIILPLLTMSVDCTIQDEL